MGKVLRTPQKWNVVTAAMKYRVPSTGRLAVGALKKIGKLFNISERTVQRCMQEYNGQMENAVDMSRKNKNAGRPSKLTEDIKKNVASIVQEYATRRIYLTNRKLAEELAKEGIRCSHMTAGKWIHDMGGDDHDLVIKPALKDHHKIHRMRFIMNKMTARGSTYTHPKNTIHVDEAWFILTFLMPLRFSIRLILMGGRLCLIHSLRNLLT
mmetsp:Transcript_22113/g.37330  ORF Transcript_22113/g.37330 Transcript_22113/m.37330 type:complete len:210 (+) Transcript_22113:36-665(+)